MLGCMGSLSVLEIGKNPHTDGQYYGIDNTCSKEPHNGVGFLGQGFLEMPSKVLRKDSNFGFSFKTMESDALLMVSTFVGQPRIGGFPNPPDYYSVSLVEGHLDIRLFAGSEKHRIISQERFNDGKLHSFFAIKQNRKILSFNEPVRFENAFIGRCSDLPRNIMAGMESDVKNEKMGRHNKKKMRIISVQLLNGHLHILIRTNRQEKKIILPPPTLNSGEWKKITLEKIKRKLKIYVNGVLRSKEKMRKRNRFGNKLFIGSIPFSIANNSEIQVYETFKGCFRNLIINNEKFEIPSLTRQDHIIGVGQCFASVQRGSYFPGDAYALYDDKFQVGPLLELQLEFRTWEHDGVLLSVNIGHSHPFSARVSHPNIFTLCDNRWHIIKAHYIKDSLTLKVDSYPEVYGFNGSNNLPKTLAEAPLYIGGIPGKMKF
ncbi:Laminin subunit alpha-2 [Armadillidium vulgare]|nr:Laminin subunit alpha-2 [Armadillidium vulgare]